MIICVKCGRMFGFEWELYMICMCFDESEVVSGDGFR